MNKLVVGMLIIPLFLTACQTMKPAVVDDSKFVIVKPPAALLNCPQLRKADLPNPETMTNAELAVLIEKTVKKLQTCGVNMAKIKQYIAEAEKIYANRRGN